LKCSQGYMVLMLLPLLQWLLSDSMIIDCLGPTKTPATSSSNHDPTPTVWNPNNPLIDEETNETNILEKVICKHMYSYSTDSDTTFCQHFCTHDQIMKWNRSYAVLFRG